MRFCFRDSKGNSVCLRPDKTASMASNCLPLKSWYPKCHLNSFTSVSFLALFSSLLLVFCTIGNDDFFMSNQKIIMIIICKQEYQDWRTFVLFITFILFLFLCFSPAFRLFMFLERENFVSCNLPIRLTGRSLVFGQHPRRKVYFLYFL